MSHSLPLLLSSHRERLEVAAHVAIVQSRGGSISLPSSPISSPVTKRMGRIGIEDFRNSTIESLEEFPLLLKDARLSDLPSFWNNETEAGDEDFWFERHVQSTAAAGRDWDWRKRRARVAKAESLNRANNSINGEFPSADFSGGFGSSDGNRVIGKTDVQLQHQQRLANRPSVTARTRSLPSSPLISFTAAELAGTQAPQLPNFSRQISSSSSDSSSLSVDLRSSGSSSPTYGDQVNSSSSRNFRPQSAELGSRLQEEQNYRLPQFTTSSQLRPASSLHDSLQVPSVTSQRHSLPASPAKTKTYNSSSLRKKLMGSKSRASTGSELRPSLETSTSPSEESSIALKRPLLTANVAGQEDERNFSRPRIPPFQRQESASPNSLPSGESLVSNYPDSAFSRGSSVPEVLPPSNGQAQNSVKQELKPQRPRIRTMSLESTLNNQEEIDTLLQEAEEYRSEQDEGGISKPTSHKTTPSKGSKRGILAGASQVERKFSYRAGALGAGDLFFGGWSSADAYGPISNAKVPFKVEESAVEPISRPQLVPRDSTTSSSSVSSTQNGSTKVGSIHSSDSGSVSEKRWTENGGSVLPVTLDYSTLSAPSSDQDAFSPNLKRSNSKSGLSPPRRGSTVGSSNGSTTSSSSSQRRRSSGLQGGSELDRITSNKSSSNGSSSGISSMTGTGDPPVMRYARPKNSKRSTILNSAGGASQVLVAHGIENKAKNGLPINGSPRVSRTSSTITDARTGKEPAPMAMAFRARTASLQSSNSGDTSTSQAQEKMQPSKRSSSIVDSDSSALKAERRLSSPPSSLPPLEPLPPLPK